MLLRVIGIWGINAGQYPSPTDLGFRILGLTDRLGLGFCTLNMAREVQDTVWEYRAKHPKQHSAT